MLENWMTHGLFLASSNKYNARERKSIEGPCCHNARLAVDQAEVQKAKMSATNRDCLTDNERRAIRYINTVVSATMNEATTSWAT